MLYVDQYGLFSESLLNFEWKSTISSYYHSTETAFIDTWNSPRFQGGMQAAGWLAEASIGAGMTYATGGLAVHAGSAVMAHGLDHFFTGINTVWTGQHSETVTSQLLQKTGLSTQTANLFDNGLSMGGIAAGAKVMASAPGFIRLPALKSTGNLAGQEVKYAGSVGMTLSRGAENVNAGINLNRKLSLLESFPKNSIKTRSLPDGRIRFYAPETIARTSGPTRGGGNVVEWNPRSGKVRGWYECYDHLGHVNRVHPKNINGQMVSSPHCPPIGAELIK